MPCGGRHLVRSEVTGCAAAVATLRGPWGTFCPEKNLVPLRCRTKEAGFQVCRSHLARGHSHEEEDKYKRVVTTCMELRSPEGGSPLSSSLSYAG